MPGKHSRWSASKFASTMASPGLTALDQLVRDGDPRVAHIGVVPDRGSYYAAEGTVAHLVLEHELLQEGDGAALLGEEIEVDGFQITVDDDMVNYACDAAEKIRAIAGDGEYTAEQQLDYSESLGLEHGTAWGTSDAVIMPGDGELIVFDLKYGRGVDVQPDDNSQMMLYAAGALELYSMMADFDTVRMIIYQPRKGGWKEWGCTVEYLQEWLGGPAKRAVNSTRLAYQSFKSLDDVEWMDAFVDALNPACRWSQWLGLLPHLKEQIAELTSSPATASEFEQAGEDWLAEAMAMVDAVRRWCDAVQETVQARLESGADVTGFKLVQGRRGARKWASEKEAEETLRGMSIKQAVMYTRKLVTPTQAEKAAKAGDIGPQQWKRLQEQIIRPDGKLTIAPMSDPREAVSLAAGADEFDHEEDASDLA